MSKIKNLFWVLLVTVFLFGSSALVASGCSGVPPVKHCVDLSELKEVPYIGTVLEYVPGQYLKTACITIDISKIPELKNLSAAALIGTVIRIHFEDREQSGNEPVYTFQRLVPDNLDAIEPVKIEIPGRFIEVRQY